jgi:ABC-2 type transport system permease protein
MRSLLHLSWLEIKVFVREPMGVVATVLVPVVLFVVMARMFSGEDTSAGAIPAILTADLPVLVAMLIAISTVLSLMTVVAIYREGGILKRLRATPLRPVTILTAHVLVKLFFTAITLALMFLAGRRYIVDDGPILSFGVALIFATTALLSIGFIVASVIPTARFAQPVGALLLYPLFGISGLFGPIESLPAPAYLIARASPFTYAVSLLRGVWRGDGWMAHLDDVAILTVTFVLLTVISGKVFRWE